MRAVRDDGGKLALAKLPGTEDDRDIVLWEGVALGLAKHAGIRVPAWRLESVATAEYYGLGPKQARRIAGAARKAVSEWREVAARLDGSRREIDRMESAFEHEDLARALRLGAP